MFRDSCECIGGELFPSKHFLKISLDTQCHSGEVSCGGMPFRFSVLIVFAIKANKARPSSRGRVRLRGGSVGFMPSDGRPPRAIRFNLEAALPRKPALVDSLAAIVVFIGARVEALVFPDEAHLLHPVVIDDCPPRCYGDNSDETAVAIPVHLDARRHAVLASSAASSTSHAASNGWNLGRCRVWWMLSDALGVDAVPREGRLLSDPKELYSALVACIRRRELDCTGGVAGIERVDGDVAAAGLLRSSDDVLLGKEEQELGLGIRHLAADTARLIHGVGSSNRQADIAQAACRDLARATARYATLELTLRNRREWPALEAALTREDKVAEGKKGGSRQWKQQ